MNCVRTSLSNLAVLRALSLVEGSSFKEFSNLLAGLDRAPNTERSALKSRMHLKCKPLKVGSYQARNSLETTFLRKHRVLTASASVAQGPRLLGQRSVIQRRTFLIAPVQTSISEASCNPKLASSNCKLCTVHAASPNAV